jgi:mannose-1-phosphate guanylyltransferase
MKSIDYAVMERTQLAAVVPADLGWSDIGSWDRSGTSSITTPPAMPPMGQWW